MEHGRLFLTLRDCSVKDAHTLLESHESGSLFGGSSASSGSIGGATSSSFGGLEGPLEFLNVDISCILNYCTRIHTE